MLITVILLTMAVTVSASPVLFPRQAAATDVDVTDVVWDGSCFYPKPDGDFELENYLGTWYQVAGTPAPFTVGCSCTTAQYALNNNGTVSVLNSCQVEGRSIDIEGTATPVSEAYGEDGVFQVSFPGQSSNDCPGPNYIVQHYEDADDDEPDDNGWSIVQASNFTTLFLLSRQRNPSGASIDRWLSRAGRLGSNLTDVVLFDQSECT